MYSACIETDKAYVEPSWPLKTVENAAHSCKENSAHVNGDPASMYTLRCVCDVSVSDDVLSETIYHAEIDHGSTSREWLLGKGHQPMLIIIVRACVLEPWRPCFQN